MSAEAVRELSLSHSSEFHYGVKPSNLYVIQQLQQRAPSTGRKVADFKSYQSFREAVQTGTVPQDVHWVLYDNERWSQTPYREQQDPAKYEKLFAALARRKGYRVILAPALDLVFGLRKGLSAGVPAWREYLALRLAALSARLANIYEIQAQSYELPVHRQAGAYLGFVRAAAAQARDVNPHIQIFAGLSTGRVASTAELTADFLATRSLVDGYWLNIPHSGDTAASELAGKFLAGLPSVASSAGPSCGLK